LVPEASSPDHNILDYLHPLWYTIFPCHIFRIDTFYQVDSFLLPPFIFAFCLHLLPASFFVIRCKECYIYRKLFLGFHLLPATPKCPLAYFSDYVFRATLLAYISLTNFILFFIFICHFVFLPPCILYYKEKII
jgi:hypothetical protein